MNDRHMTGIKVLTTSVACLTLRDVHGKLCVPCLLRACALIDDVFSGYNMRTHLFHQCAVQEQGLYLWVNLRHQFR